MIDFLLMLEGWHEWTVEDLPQLVFWVDAILEDIRTAIDEGDANYSNVRHEFSIPNVDLQYLLHVIQHRRFKALTDTEQWHMCLLILLATIHGFHETF